MKSYASLGVKAEFGGDLVFERWDKMLMEIKLSPLVTIESFLWNAYCIREDYKYSKKLYTGTRYRRTYLKFSITTQL